MQTSRSERLRRLTAHWPELSPRGRLGLLLALFVNGIVTMTLEVFVVAALWRGARDAWQARHAGLLSVGRAAAGAALPLTVLSVLQKAVARVAFTSYERWLRRRSQETV